MVVQAAGRRATCPVEGWSRRSDAAPDPSASTAAQTSCRTATAACRAIFARTPARGGLRRLGRSPRRRTRRSAATRSGAAIAPAAVGTDGVPGLLPHARRRRARSIRAYRRRVLQPLRIAARARRSARSPLASRATGSSARTCQVRRLNAVRRCATAPNGGRRCDAADDAGLLRDLLRRGSALDGPRTRPSCHERAERARSSSDGRRSRASRRSRFAATRSGRRDREGRRRRRRRAASSACLRIRNATRCRRPFTALKPCPPASDNTLAFDTATLPNGTHTVQASVTDAAGNETRSDPVTVTTRNGSRPNGRGASRFVQLTAWLRSRREARRAATTVPYGAVRFAEGRLTDSAGAPIAGAVLDVKSRVQRPGARYRTRRHRDDERERPLRLPHRPRPEPLAALRVQGLHARSRAGLERHGQPRRPRRPPAPPQAPHGSATASASASSAGSRAAPPARGPA